MELQIIFNHNFSFMSWAWKSVHHPFLPFSALIIIIGKESNSGLCRENPS